MQDLRIAIANDTLREDVFDTTRQFHSVSYNRGDRLLNGTPGFPTLTSKQLSASEFAELTFGGKQMVLGSPDDPGERLASAPPFEASAPLGLATFRQILGRSYMEHERDGRVIRPYGSGGALYSVQVVIHVRNVDGVPSGIYHVLPKAQALEAMVLGAGDIHTPLFGEGGSDWADYDFTILYVALPNIPFAKYGARAYRLMLLEAGAMVHAATLSAEAVGLRQRTWGGFDDERLSVAMGVDPRAAWPLIAQLFGRVNP
jgi:SagB-type dehydrogenase family enzyme